MYKRPTVHSDNVAIEDKIGSSYEDVKIVADNIDSVIILAEGMEIYLKYVGSGETPPTTRLDASPLEDGDYYFHSTDTEEELYYYRLSDDTWHSGGQGGGGAVDSVNGYTGVVVLTKADIGLSNVDDTSDIGKPISTAMQTALDDKVNNSQVLTDVPVGAEFTDTTYSVQDGELSEKNFTQTKSDKLDGVEANATSDQTGSEIKSLYEGEANTNAFTDTEKTKLSNIESNAQVNTVESVAGKTGTVTLDKSDVGLVNVDNTSDVNKPVSSAQQTEIDTKIDASEKGAANGVAELDGTGKVPASQLPVTGGGVEEAPVDGIAYNRKDGDWEAASVGGGIPDAPADGNQYARKDNAWDVVTSGTGAVDSVNGQTGIVVLDKDDINLDQVDNTSDVNKPVSTAQQAEIDTKQDTLVNQTNLKSVNGETLLGSGDVIIPVFDDSDVLKDSDTLSPVNAGNKIITEADVTGGGDMSKSTYDTSNNGIVDNAELVNGLTVETAVPSGAVFTDTDTIYDDTTIQTEVDLNTAKVGITPQQASDITANNAKVSNVDHPLVETAVPSGAVFTDTVYTHPANHAPSIITQDSNNRFVTDAEKALWNAGGGGSNGVVIPHTGGGTLTAGGEENQIRDGGVYVVPLANSVAVNTVCIVTLPDTYDTFTPTLNVSGSDDFRNADGTDTEVSIAGSVYVILTSNGTDEWFIDVVSGSRGADGINIPTEVVSEFPGTPVTGTLYIKV